MAYEFNPNRLPDSHFLPGHLKYLVPGNEGRCLDPRRTPGRVLEVKRDSGFFVLEILDFEDKGGRWELPLERVNRCQFSPGSVEASAADVAAYVETISRLDRPLEIPVDPADAARSLATIATLSADVDSWLRDRSAFFDSGTPADVSVLHGSPDLWADLQRYMTEVGLWDVEAAIAEQYVRNADSGELIKGHSIVLAEVLGLVPFHGKVVRDSQTFLGPWSKERRAGHIQHRLAFVRAVFHRLGLSSVILYRGWSAQVPREVRRSSFISATFELDVAMSHFNQRDRASTGALFRQSVSVDRVFMSFLETAHMNRQFREAEAVLLRGRPDEIF